MFAVIEKWCNMNDSFQTRNLWRTLVEVENRQNTSEELVSDTLSNCMEPLITIEFILPYYSPLQVSSEPAAWASTVARW